LKYSNGDISAADRPIYSLFGSRMGFSGSADRMAHFRFRQIQDGGSAAILKKSNGDISAADRPIYSVFGSRMGFSGSADRMALFPVSPYPRWRLGRHLEIFKWRYLGGGSSDLLRVWFQDEVFGVGGSNGAISGFAKSKMAVKNSNGDISAADRPMYSVFGSRMGFRGRRIKRRYFRFCQIQDGGILKNSNVDISAADHPIYSVFDSRMGFSVAADQMALIPV